MTAPHRLGTAKDDVGLMPNIVETTILSMVRAHVQCPLCTRVVPRRRQRRQKAVRPRRVGFVVFESRVRIQTYQAGVCRRKRWVLVDGRELGASRQKGRNNDLNNGQFPSATKSTLDCGPFAQECSTSRSWHRKTTMRQLAEVLFDAVKVIRSCLQTAAISRVSRIGADRRLTPFSPSAWMNLPLPSQDRLATLAHPAKRPAPPPAPQARGFCGFRLFCMNRAKVNTISG
jgi:hypothetical protein